MSMPLNEIHKDALILLYAQNSILYLDSHPELISVIFGGIQGINSVIEVEKQIPEYKEFSTCLRTIKNNLEGITNFPETPSQVRYCLIQLSNIIQEGNLRKINIFNKLVEEMLVKKLWIDCPDLIAQYIDASNVIQTWNHFFVSYTTRDIPAVNNMYDPELFKEFPAEVVKKELDMNNLIAKYVVRCFTDYNDLKVFFDRDSIFCGDKIKDEVYKYCEKTFAFVQIIEDIIFKREPDGINWCYNEYEHFNIYNSKDLKRKFFFKIDGFDIDINNVNQEYYDWVKDILDTKYETIFKPFDRITVKKKCKEFADKIKELRIKNINSLIKAVA